MTNFFNKNLSQAYDERNSKLTSISDNTHFLSGIILRDLPKDARILCVGVGTGVEIVALAKNNPEWTFVGVDPSADMVDVCRDRLEKEGLSDQTELIVGYVTDVTTESQFDAVLSILVGHFIKKEERVEFYQNIHKRLKEGGYFINTEISFDLDSEEFPLMLKNWEGIQALMGATPESLENLPKLLRDPLTVLPLKKVEDLMKEASFPLPIRFFQSFMIAGWFAKK